MEKPKFPAGYSYRVEEWRDKADHKQLDVALCRILVSNR
jgi:hypothetical protein